MVNLNVAVESQTYKPQADTNLNKQSLNKSQSFDTRHIGVDEQQISQMLQVLGIDSCGSYILTTLFLSHN